MATKILIILLAIFLIFNTIFLLEKQEKISELELQLITLEQEKNKLDSLLIETIKERNLLDIAFEEAIILCWDYQTNLNNSYRTNIFSGNMDSYKKFINDMNSLISYGEDELNRLQIKYNLTW